MDEHREPDAPADCGGAQADCEEALTELYGFLDGELTVERRTLIRGHLDGCHDCLGAFDFEAELRTVIASRCREEVPEGLRERVARALESLGDVDEASGPVWGR